MIASRDGMARVSGPLARVPPVNPGDLGGICQEMTRRSPLSAIAALVIAAVVGAACGDAPVTTSGGTIEPTVAGSTPPAPATPDPTSAIDAIIQGDWRRVPFDARPSPDVRRLDATCRSAEPRIAGLPVAVIDARGRGRLVIVYASSPTSAAWECLATTIAVTAADVQVRALQESGEPLADDDIDAVDYRVTEFGDLTGVILVGRVGTLGVKVITQFDGDESYIYGSRGTGWYAIWWRGTEAINAVAATDIHNLVVGNVVPELR